MLKDVRIQNYRLFEDLQVNDLGRVNLIVGQNNVGKTSLLEALYLLSGQGDSINLFNILSLRQQFLNSNLEKHDYEVDNLFNDKLDVFSFEISSPQKASSVKVHLINEGDPKLTISAGNYFFGGEIIEGKIDGSLLTRSSYISSVRKKNLQTQEDIFLTTKGFSYNFLAELWDKTQLTPQEEAVIKMLQIINSKVNRVGFPSRVSSLPVIQIKIGDKLQPLSSLGDGMSRLLAIALSLANSANHALFIDEIDTGLHYRMMTKMWEIVLKTAQELNVQVFATTHSLDCIKAFSEALKEQENSDLGRLIRLQQYEDGEIEAVNYTPEELSFSIFQEIEVR